MQLSKLTFSLASLVLLMAFFAMPVMAHIAPGDDPHQDPDAVPVVGGIAHVLVESFTIDTTNLTATNTITATIKFAAEVDAVDDVTATMDDAATTTVTENNEARHAISNPTASPRADDLELNARKALDGMFTDTDGNGLRVLSITQTTAPTDAVGTTPGTGAVWTVFIANATANADGMGDGVYRLSVDAPAYSPKTAMPVITLDTVLPDVMDPVIGSSGGSTANLAGEWSDPFIVSVTIVEMGSGLDTSTLKFTAVPDEVTFDAPGRVGNTFTIVATPNANMTASDKSVTDVEITVSIMDNAGNSHMNSVNVMLAAREGTGTDTGEGDEPTEKPRVRITTSQLDTTARTFRVDINLTPANKADGTAGDAITDLRDALYVDLD